MKTMMKAISGALVLAASLGANAEIQLGGSIEPILTLEIAEAASIADLDLTTSANYLLIATTTENSNLQNGYNIDVTSANGFYLTSAEEGAAPFKYRLYFNQTEWSVEELKSFGASNVYQTPRLENGETVINDQHDLTMSYEGISAAELVAGSYNDTIAITIQAN